MKAKKNFDSFSANRLAKIIVVTLIILSVLYVLFKRKDGSISDRKVTFSSSFFESILSNSKRTIIVDVECLKRLKSGKTCNTPVKIAIIKPALFTSRFEPNRNEALEIEFLLEDDLTKEYWVFKAVGNEDRKQAMKRFPLNRATVTLGASKKFKMEVPKDIDRFIREWPESRFIDCAPILKRNETDLVRFLPVNFMGRVAQFVDHLAKFNITGFLFGGTLLGWLRECSLIPHTGDVDIGLFGSQHSQAMLDSLIGHKEFILKWILGRPSDSLELTLWMDNYKIDLFYLYYNATRGKSYASGINTLTRQQKLYFYPEIKEPLCSAELEGRLFHIPCNYERTIQADYGPEEWKKDFPTSTFNWEKSHKNVEEGRIYTEEEWNTVYRLYWPRNETKTP